MINYSIKTVNVKLTQQEWKEFQNGVVVKAMNEQTQIQKQEIISYALDMVVQSKIREALEELDKFEDKTIVPIAPNVEVILVDENKFEAQIKITYYSLSELEKFDYKNLKFDFAVQPLKNEFLELAFQKFTQSYPLLTPIQDFVQVGDHVTIDYSVIHPMTGNVLDQKQNITLVTRMSPGFSINSLLLNRMPGNSFKIRDPKGNDWMIIIKGNRRPIPTTLTNNNINKTGIENINSLEDLKKRLFMDFRKEHYSSELLRFYERTMREIVVNSKMNFSPENLKMGLVEYFQKISDGTANIDPDEVLKDKDPKTIELVASGDKSTKAKIIASTFEFMVLNTEKIKVTDKEIENETNYIQSMLTSNNKMANKKLAESILTRQKIALSLAKVINKDVYTVISKELNLRV
ncbi:trigger factor-related chaperone [Mycoplasma sp. Mirounga ES2805-ORL]|uniref:trigger factor-related chaperone n=1 Tax=Mycoplasma sp. Mirounga ES2805-ORL TaxID=754514 RepID=UPI00197B9CFF|nr:hypothetical protein [Mycoplasma sp. Mirounga ES2805-ORL]QSF13640.1 hypothetical protein JXZ90_03165 [Mycoplasma sp. Mirounga ES2805-ORL]